MSSNSIAIFNKHGQIGHLPAYCRLFHHPVCSYEPLTIATGTGSVRLAALVDNSVLAIQIQPEKYDSNCSGAAEFNVRVGIFCVEEDRDKIAFVNFTPLSSSL